MNDFLQTQDVRANAFLCRRNECHALRRFLKVATQTDESDSLKKGINLFNLL